MTEKTKGRLSEPAKPQSTSEKNNTIHGYKPQESVEMVISIHKRHMRVKDLGERYEIRMPMHDYKLFLLRLVIMQMVDWINVTFPEVSA